MAKRKITLPEPPALPPSHLMALQDAGFTVVRYLHKAVTVQVEEGRTQSEWLPALCVAPGERPNTYRVIEWRPKEHPQNAYGHDGWDVCSGHTFGGFYETIGGALSWFNWHEEQKRKVYA